MTTNMQKTLLSQRKATARLTVSKSVGKFLTCSTDVEMAAASEEVCSSSDDADMQSERNGDIDMPDARPKFRQFPEY